MGSYKIAETIIYGYYLHADTDKIDSLHQIPIKAITLAIAPFVFKREEILHKAADIFKNCQTEIPKREAVSSGFLLLDSRTAEKRQIKASPFWKNAYGHDATYNEIEMAAQANSYEDNLVYIKVASVMRRSNYSPTSSALGKLAPSNTPYVRHALLLSKNIGANGKSTDWQKHRWMKRRLD